MQSHPGSSSSKPQSRSFHRTVITDNLKDSFIVVHINRHVARCLLDTGSQHNLVSLSWCRTKKIHIRPLELGQQTNLWAANGTPLKIHGIATLNIRIKGLVFDTDCFVIEDLSDHVILGTSFMTQHSVVLDYVHGTVQLDNNSLSIPLANKQSRQRAVRTTRSVFVPAMSEAIVPVTVHRHFIGHNIFLMQSPAQSINKFITTRSVAKPVSANTVCRLLNFNSHPIVLRRNECVAIVADVLNDDELFSNSVNRLSSEMPKTTPAQKIHTDTPTHEELDKFVTSMGLNISSKASIEDRYKIAELLFEFQDLFKTSVKDIKQCNIPPFELQLRSNKGVYTRQYKLAPEDAEIIESQVKDMEQAKVIEPAIGFQAQQYNSSVMLVPKRDTNAKRLVLDYRKVNNIIEPVILTLPPIADLVSEIASKRSAWYTTLDIISYFWQLPLAKN